MSPAKADVVATSQWQLEVQCRNRGVVIVPDSANRLNLLRLFRLKFQIFPQYLSRLQILINRYDRNLERLLRQKPTLAQQRFRGKAPAPQM